jgi:hypothetical protein
MNSIGLEGFAFHWERGRPARILETNLPNLFNRKERKDLKEPALSGLCVLCVLCG